MRSVRLTGMGPKLLISDATTRSQPLLRWQLRVKGNTAVEFGVIPAALEVGGGAAGAAPVPGPTAAEGAVGVCELGSVCGPQRSALCLQLAAGWRLEGFSSHTACFGLPSTVHVRAASRSCPAAPALQPSPAAGAHRPAQVAQRGRQPQGASHGVLLTGGGCQQQQQHGCQAHKSSLPAP